MMKMNKRLFFIGAAASLGGFLTGYNVTFTGALPSIVEFYHLNDFMLGIIGSVLMVGCLLGVLVAGSLNRIIGFKKIFIFSGVLFLISPLLASLTNSIELLIFCRVLLGFSFGIDTALTPIYIAEISTPQVRGKLVSFFQVSIVTGILLAYITVYLLSGINSNDWRYMLAIPAVPSIIYISLIYFLPESPRWLMMKNKEIKAHKVLSDVVDKNYADTEIMVIKSNPSPNTKIDFRMLFNSYYAKIVIIGILLTILQQLTGVTAILVYVSIILQKCGFGGTSYFLQMIFIGMVYFSSSFLAVFYADHWGRKPMLIWGLFSIAMSLTGLSAFFYFDLNTPALAMFLIILFWASYGSTSGPIMWILLSEIFPAKIKRGAITVVTIVLWSATGITTFVFPLMIEKIGSSFTFLICALFTFFHVWFIKRFVPETKGKSLEEIEKEILH